MSDDTSFTITGPPDSASVYYTYTPQQEAARAQLIELIEAEKRAYLERVEPYVKRLANIQGTPHFIIRTGLR